MKKRVCILVMALCLFCCFFALVANASVTGSNDDSFGEIKIINGINSDTKIKDKESRVVLKNDDGTYTTYPAYYISDNALQWQGTVMYMFDSLNSLTGEKYSMDSIVRLEILTDSYIMNNNGGSFQDRKNLKEIAFPTGTQIKEICGQQFKNSGLEKICIPKTVTTLASSVFEGCSSLIDVTFEDGFSMTSLPAQLFSGCSSLEEITIPDCVESYGNAMFGYCTNLKVVRFGKNYKTMGTQPFSRCLQNMVIYAPSTFLSDYDTIKTGHFSYDSSDMHKVTLFFDGTLEQAQALVNKAQHRGLKEATLIEWDGKEDSYYIPTNPSAWTIVYSYNTCSHKWSEKDELKVIDFYSPIQVGKACTKCAKVEEKFSIAPIFVCLGISKSESSDSNGSYGVVIGYIMNREAYKQFTDYSSFEFGFVASTSTVNLNPLTIDNGGVNVADTSKSYMKKMTVDCCSVFELRVNGITSKMNGKGLILSMYVYYGEKLYYLNEDGQKIEARVTSIN